MRFVIVTGMSGAGKSTALKVLEDFGYFCVDNLPVPLFIKFAEFAAGDTRGEYDRIALGMDIRSGQGLLEIEEALSNMKNLGMQYEILFLDSSDDVLIERYKETRRSHPLAGNGRVEDGIALEREQIEFLKKKADHIIDTSRLLTRELRKQLEDIFLGNVKFNNFMVTVVSFGFKYGIPRDADLVFDVRFLANPFYIPELKYKTGNDKEVRDFVMNTETALAFKEKLTDMVKFLIPNYINEGKNQLVIGIGCTGGRHRSVTLANVLSEELMGLGYGIKTEHRDIGKDGRNVIFK
ncbi:MAG: RNase adapter RapZ [Lachnospiraceae bacterium]|nr:RNase adapter RapZ [Lachnospiraceae bacterium]